MLPRSAILRGLRYDKAVPAFSVRSHCGSGAYGDYFVHPSGKYGIKVFAPNETFVQMGMIPKDYDWTIEPRNLAMANAAGVPSPKLIKVTDKAFVMEHLQGYKTLGELSTHKSDEQPWAFGKNIPVEVKKRYVQMMREMHLKGIAHGDPHANNVMYNEKTGQMRLVDWGLARKVDDRATQADLIGGMDGPTRLTFEMGFTFAVVGADINEPKLQAYLPTLQKRSEKIVNILTKMKSAPERSRFLSIPGTKSRRVTQWEAAQKLINDTYDDLTKLFLG